ncbi:tRNA N(3)-methylcytidine methyltransferase METTL8, mitochondrial [Sinocyclocheilus grahami]|uniref:tRNA N(3)-methylcytidine methyltransferase METTL8, mitochondrial n=1 Tax=Sinocyclocheilus grahami TaxID=75366 RepID=UPI0007ACD5FB|nr:PREDICTED: methyltransferase-like protein 2-A [Sinocyclocheilus grahami]
MRGLLKLAARAVSRPLSGGRPPAPLGGRVLTAPEDIFQHNMWVGCGAGNSVFPIINTIRGSKAFLYCCDFSSQAIELIQEHPDYDPAVCHAFVRDICDTASPFPFPPESLDIILVVFVLSAIHPARLIDLLLYNRAWPLPTGQCLSENFYTRQDGTCVYFFTKDEVHHLFSNAGLEELQNLEDRRLQVNRGKKVVMHRVWMQSKYRKPCLISD